MIMAKIFTYRGKTVEELKSMSIEEFSKLLPSRERRHLVRGMSEKEKKFLGRLKKSEKPVRTHLENSLKLLSDRKSPDYRNSIKESISAVEAICRLIAKDKNATLGQALKVVENKVGLHGALKASFSSLYGYTSSAKGIRHALGLLEEPSLSFEDSKFMLVSCSAFINYLISKASKAGIKIG